MLSVDIRPANVRLKSSPGVSIIILLAGWKERVCRSGCGRMHCGNGVPVILRKSITLGSVPNPSLRLMEVVAGLN